MNPTNHSWKPLDPAAGDLPDGIQSVLGDKGSPLACIVVLVDSEIDPNWGAQATIAVAKGWAASGYNVILADACLDRPVLHEAAGVENGEGVSDMVLYGASLPRIAAQIGGGLLLASAGTPVVQVDDVLKHVKWDMVIRGCSEAGATLVLYVSAVTPGAEAVLDRAEAVLVLAHPSTDVEAVLGNAMGSLVAVLGPGTGDAVPSAMEQEEQNAVPTAVEGEETDAAAVWEQDTDVPPVVPEEEIGNTAAVAIENHKEDVASVTLEDEEGDLSSVDELPGLPKEDEGDLGPADGQPEFFEQDEEMDEPDLEASPELLEAEAPSTTSGEDRPEQDAGPEEEEEDDTADTFSMKGLQGGQYDSDDSQETEVESPDPDSSLALASSPDGVADAEGPDDVEDAAFEMVDESVAAEEEVSEGLEGFETGAGHDLGDVPGAVEDLSDPPSLEMESPAFSDDDGGGALDEESVGVAAGEHADYGAVDLGEDDSTESQTDASLGFGPAPGFESPDDSDGGDAAVGAGDEASPAKDKTKYRGLARMERRRKMAALGRLLAIVLVTILIVGGGGVSAVYFGLFGLNIPGITPPERVRAYAPAPVELPGPLPETAVMSHVLAVDSWRTIETPLSTAAALRERLPNLLIFVTPLNVEGSLEFALHVGPAYGAVEANALKDPVAVVLDRLDPEDWSVREAPYAFFFGEYDTVADAEGRIQALAGASIPAYWLQVGYRDDRTRIRVYGGAFSDEFQASEMGQMISDADVGGMILTGRRGTLPE